MSREPSRSGPRRGTPPAPELDRARGCLLGLAAGDAVGTTLEFRTPGTFEPLTDMVGGGPFGLDPGCWTDDTSMALCLGESLRSCGAFDARDQMQRYLRWLGTGYLSSTGTCFDVGGTVHASLSRFAAGADPYAGPIDEDTAGNGCIMRLAPVALFFHPDVDAVRHWSRESSRTTHGAMECIECCEVLATYLTRLVGGADRKEALDAGGLEGVRKPRVRKIVDTAGDDKPRSRIRGSGYVVDCLEAAVWCFARSSSFRECVLEAANLGDDADTTAAVAGQLAGAHWGESGIPAGWIDKLALADFIRTLATDLVSA